MERSEIIKQLEGYKTGENYAYLGLLPHFLIFDEYVTFMEMQTTVRREGMSKWHNHLKTAMLYR